MNSHELMRRDEMGYLIIRPFSIRVSIKFKNSFIQKCVESLFNHGLISECNNCGVESCSYIGMSLYRMTYSIHFIDGKWSFRIRVRILSPHFSEALES